MITMDELTDNIKEGIMQLASNREVLSELSTPTILLDYWQVA
jgi:hypothetical protein